MKKSDALDLYVDYLLANSGQATATELSALTDNSMKHDYISDCLAQEGLDQKVFWKQVKPFVREHESENGAIIIDDTIVDKLYSTINEVINYHFDHTKGMSVKGINLLNFLYNIEVGGEFINCPIAFHVIRKDQPYIDENGNRKFRSSLTKNQLMRDILRRLVFINQIKCKYILFDMWFSANDNLKFIQKDLKKTFVCPLKKNRLIALSYEDKLAGNFISVESLNMTANELRTVYIKGLDFEVQLVRKVFTNKDRSEGELYLITNDISMDYEQISKIYQGRWKIEEYHKSLKQNALLGKSPTKMETSQCNHIFTANLAYLQLERLKIKERLNHFALKAKIRLKMLMAALDEVHALKMS